MTFKLIRSQEIKELNSFAKLYVHIKTGARLLSITNEDENKCFGINFRTPPQDSTGIAHILEHSVLCGSEKYPVKEPFVEIIKGSLQTFVNAFTYPDKTCYPCASQNLQDFYNLIDIYNDAVFYPKLTELTFQQEGWHYEIENENDPLQFKGVVFNEMKGAYSSPEDLLSDKSRNSIFPNNSYQYDSGGDPSVMPDLTYQQFKSFHQNLYHPSNSYIFFYGDDPEENRLEIMEKVLGQFEANTFNSSISDQPNFAHPVTHQFPYDSGDTPDPKGYITINWKLSPAIDIQNSLKFSLLDHILLGTAASIMKRVLLESGLGEDLTGGFDDHLKETMFSIGLKGVDPENFQRVETLIMDTLDTIVKSGIDPEMIKASLNTLEFQLREQNTGNFPRGLALMISALSTWIYGGDPIDALSFEPQLAQIKKDLATPGIFENLISDYLIKNPHRATVKLVPDAEEGNRRNEIEQTRLSKHRETLSKDEITSLIKSTEALKKFQETPDSEAALATIPSLSISDLERNIKVSKTNTTNHSEFVEYHQEIATNGILYFDIGFDLSTIPQNLLPYVGILGKLLLELGTKKYDFIKLTQKIGQDTGGIRTASFISNKFQSQKSVKFFFLRGKALTDQATDLFDILSEIINNVDLDQKDRLKQIITERRSGLEAGLIPGGSSVIHQRLKAHFSTPDRILDEINGINQIFFLRQLIEQIEQDWPSVLQNLRTITRALFNKNNAVVNSTIDAEGYSSLSNARKGFMDSLSASKNLTYDWQYEKLPSNEVFTLPSQVNYVGSGYHLYSAGYEFNGNLNVINNYLQTTYLWERVRVQGGAYGGFSVFDHITGVFDFLSYRDPNVLSTIENYDNTGNFLCDLKISDSELTKSIIGTIGDMDGYLLPDAKGWQALGRLILEYSPEARQKIRDDVFAVKPSDFQKFGALLNMVKPSAETVILGSANSFDTISTIKEQPVLLRKLL